jgi:hypothetical protein
MLRFNLLPTQFRERLLFSQKMRKMGGYIKIFVGLLAILSFFLLFALIYLQHQRDFFISELTSTQNDPQNIIIEQIQRNIGQFNEQLKQSLGSTPSINWASLLIDLSSRSPEGIYLNSFIVQDFPPLKKVTLQGKADRRDQLMEFENLLKSSSFFTDINSPLSNYQKTQDILFQISLTIKNP